MRPKVPVFSKLIDRVPNNNVRMFFRIIFMKLMLPEKKPDNVLVPLNELKCVFVPKKPLDAGHLSRAIDVLKVVVKNTIQFKANAHLYCLIFIFSTCQANSHISIFFKTFATINFY